MLAWGSLNQMGSSQAGEHAAQLGEGEFRQRPNRVGRDVRTRIDRQQPEDPGRSRVKSLIGEFESGFDRWRGLSATVVIAQALDAYPLSCERIGELGDAEVRVRLQKRRSDLKGQRKSAAHAGQPTCCLIISGDTGIAGTSDA